MKAKARDGHATIITCVTPPCIFSWGYACYDCCMPIPCLCLHAAPYFSCHHHCIYCILFLYFLFLALSSIKILMKYFSHLYIYICDSTVHTVMLYVLLILCAHSRSPTMHSIQLVLLHNIIPCLVLDTLHL